MSTLDPIYISPDARKELTTLVRDWTGWSKAKLHIGGVPDHAAAMCLHEQREIRVDLEKLVLNPNRVLLTVNPFRLRQEGVLTGALMHEAAHARHTHWKPRTAAEMASRPLLHTDGTEPTPTTVALARILEEPRVEYRILSEARKRIGGRKEEQGFERVIFDLGWTMRATAAHLIHPTKVSEDPDQAVMDVLGSWVLRAGRQHAYQSGIGGRYSIPHWVSEFDALLYETVVKNLRRRVELGAVLGTPTDAQAREVIRRLKVMCRQDDDTTPYTIDQAREILDLLFPETPAEAGGGGGANAPVSVAASCQGSASPSTEEDEDEEGSEDDSEESGEGSGDDEESGEGDGVSDLEKALSASEHTELEIQLQDLEATSEAEEAEEARERAGSSAGGGPPRPIGGGWRLPSKEEREIHRAASKFLRDLIEPNEATDRSLSEQPSAMVDGAALSAWKAGGQTRDPQFFVRTRRSVEPTPPVQVAILVDVSSSMKILQAPSALLSWALASAALDLRNFAGRGTQVESCLVHWGNGVEVIQKPGELLKGIREVPCDQGTTAMARALAEVEEIMPGFFDVHEKPVNRLLVQFTDWGLWQYQNTTPWIQKALASGVNMLSVVPSNYSFKYSPLEAILQECKVQNGSASMVMYKDDPEAVWTAARDILRDPTVQMMSQPTEFDRIF